MSVPLTIPNLQLWLDATDATTLSALSADIPGNFQPIFDNQPVGFWGDKSGYNRHFTYFDGTTALRPSYKTIGLENNLSAIRFTNSFLTSDFSINFTQQTVFVVVACNSYVTSSRIYTQATGDRVADEITNYMHFVPVLVSGSARYSSAGATGSPTSAATKGLSGFDIITVKHGGTTGVVRHFNNGFPGSSTGTQTFDYYVRKTRLGASINTSNTIPTTFFNGDIAEVIVYDRELTTIEQGRIETYLANKYKILIPHTYAIKSGYWSDTTTWVTSTLPHSACNVYANSHTVIIDRDISVGALRTDSPASAYISDTGGFVVTRPVSINAALSGFRAGLTTCLLGSVSSGNTILSGAHIGGYRSNATSFTQLSASTVILYGNILPRAAGTGATLINNTGNMQIRGNITGGGVASSDGVYNYDTLTIYGNVSSANSTVNNFGLWNIGGNAYTTIYGNIHGTAQTAAASESRAIFNDNGILTIYGDVIGNGNCPATGALYVQRGVVDIYGNVLAGNTCCGMFTNRWADITIHGSIINNLNGRQALYVTGYKVNPVPLNSYTRFAGSTATNNPVFFYSPEAYALSYMPNMTSVKLGTEYGGVMMLDKPVYTPVQLRGTMYVPSISTVALGTQVGNSTGIAIVNSDSLKNCWNLNVNMATVYNSVGMRIRNIASVADIGEQIGSADI
jgi:hypothetical protein